MCHQNVCWWKEIVLKRRSWPPDMFQKLGKGKLIFLEEGAKVNARYYQQILREHLIEIQQLSGNRPYTLQQDGATSHTAHATITFIEQSVPDCIEKDNWPSNNCDRNPLDYSI